MKQIFIVVVGIFFLVPQLFAADSSVIKIHVKMYEKDTFFLHINLPYSSTYFNRDSSLKKTETVCFYNEGDITCPPLEGCNLYKIDVRAKLYDDVLRELNIIYFKIKETYRRMALYLNYKDLIFYKSGDYDPLLLKTFDGPLLYNRYLNHIIEINPLSNPILKKTNAPYFALYDSSYRSFAWGMHLYEIYKMYSNSASLKEKFDTYENFKVYKAFEPTSAFIPLIENYVKKRFESGNLSDQH